MARLGPFDAGRRVVAAVSGGADSMALAWLLRRWGDPVAMVVDHGLRAGSDTEAALTVARLAAIGVPAHTCRLDLAKGPGLGSRARTARYAALFDTCRALGRADLVTGHHARDQVETVQLREAGGSGPSGLAAMPAVAYRDEARLLRPLLGVAPDRLRATLMAAGVAWVEDPTNHDPATARGALRQAEAPMAALLTLANAAGARRAVAEAQVAAALAHQVAIFPTGHATVSGVLPEAAWSALIWFLSGRDHPPSPDAVRRLAARGGGTLHGVWVGGGLAVREPSSLPAPVPAVAGAVWDRFRLNEGIPGGALGALGAEAPLLRRRPGLGSRVLRTLPAVRVNGKLWAVAHLLYPGALPWPRVKVEFRPIRPASGAPFVPG